MATSGALATSNQYVKYKITVTQNSQNVTANTSNVTVSVRFYRTNTGYTTYGSGTVYCKINGTTYSASVTPDQKITSSGIVLFTKTLTISHNADGTKTLNTTAWITMDTPLKSSEQSYDQALTTIPRATAPTVSVSSANMGTSITISMNRASSTFTHTLWYTFGAQTGTIGSGLGTSTSWTIPLTLANIVPNSTEGVLIIYCNTYNGSTKIGTKSVTIKALVPSTVTPSISGVTVTEGVSGLASKFGAFIKNQSKLNVSITASGSYSSSIVSCISKACGKTYNGTSFTVDAVNLCETVNIQSTVTDSRGRTATYTKAVTVLEYTSPNIILFYANRCNQDGTLNDEGNYLCIGYQYSITALNNLNDKSCTIAYKKDGDEEYTTIKSESVYGNNSIFTTTVQFSEDYAYKLRITISDYFRSSSYEIEVPTAFTLVDYHSSGKGIAFGKVAESAKLFDENLPAVFRSSALFEKGITYNLPIINVDLDTISKSGFYYCGNSATNRPVNMNGYLEVFVYSTSEGFVYQRYITYDGNSYERVQISGTWSDWCGKFTNSRWIFNKKLDGTMEGFAKIPISNLAMANALSTWFRSEVISGSNYAYPVKFTAIPSVSMQYYTTNGYGGLVWATTGGSVDNPPDFYIIRPTSASGANGYVDIQVKGKWK